MLTLSNFYLEKCLYIAFDPNQLCGTNYRSSFSSLANVLLLPALYVTSVLGPHEGPPYNHQIDQALNL